MEQILQKNRCQLSLEISKILGDLCAENSPGFVAYIRQFLLDR